MYRSTWEADRARIVALEQELADVRAALAARDAPPTEARAEDNPARTLLLIFGGIVLLNIVAFWVGSTQPAPPSDEESVPMKVLREL